MHNKDLSMSESCDPYDYCLVLECTGQGGIWYSSSSIASFRSIVSRVLELNYHGSSSNWNVIVCSVLVANACLAQVLPNPSGLRS